MSRFGTLLQSAAALVLAATSAAHAQSTSLNGKIAYTVCGPSSIPFFPDQCDIWTMNPDGSAQTNLTATTDRNEAGPAWSPDGLRIAYFEGWSDYTLMVMDADGTNAVAHPTTLSFPASAAPTWSPDGTRIAFVGFVPDPPLGPRTDVVAIDLQTGVETIVTGPVDFGGILLDATELEPAWSPTGDKIAFASVRPEQYPDPITGEPTDGAQWEIAIVNTDGSGDQVVSAGEPGSDRASFLEEDRAPAWSPDGQMLVFMSQAQVPSCCGPWQIWAVNRDGTGATNLTNDETVNDMWPSWSPDGTQIVFSRSNGAGGTDLWAFPAPTSLPAPAPLAAARLADAATSTLAASAATRLTFDGNASDPDWGRNPDAPPPAPAYTLSVTVESIGVRDGGRVTSAPAGIRCGRDCTETYATGTVVTLTAQPRRKAAFVGWSGACSGVSPTCTVTMDQARAVRATFEKP